LAGDGVEDHPDRLPGLPALLGRHGRGQASDGRRESCRDSPTRLVLVQPVGVLDRIDGKSGQGYGVGW
jgi:hypothetical protein